MYNIFFKELLRASITRHYSCLYVRSVMYVCSVSSLSDKKDMRYVYNLRVKSFARQAPHSCLESFKSRFRSHVRANVRAHFFGLTAFLASLLSSLYSAVSK